MSYKQQLLVNNHVYSEIYSFDNEADYNAYIEYLENETEYEYINLTKLKTNTVKQTIKQAISMDIPHFIKKDKNALVKKIEEVKDRLDANYKFEKEGMNALEDYTQALKNNKF